MMKPVVPIYKQEQMEQDHIKQADAYNVDVINNGSSGMSKEHEELEDDDLFTDLRKRSDTSAQASKQIKSDFDVLDKPDQQDHEP